MKDHVEGLQLFIHMKRQPVFPCASFSTNYIFKEIMIKRNQENNWLTSESARIQMRFIGLIWELIFGIQQYYY